MSETGTPVDDEPARWLLLIHQLPAKPAYLRVKVWRRLRALGAVAAKNSVYVLPAGEQAQEDFEWLLKEIAEGGGEGMICEARLVDGLSDEDVRGLFGAARAEDYDGLAKDVRALADTLDASGGAAGHADAMTKLARLRAEVAKVAAIDFFGANGRETVEGLLAGLERRLQEGETMADDRPAKVVGGAPADELRARCWVTRQGVYVDRIASAWLICRFIQPEARFKFVPAKGYTPEPGEVRFDMYDGEITHEGDRCTFEVLLARAGLADPALAAIGEIVHDLDFKDGKFGRTEVSGIGRLVEGVAVANADDESRLARGAAIFDSLYESFRARRGSAAS